MKDLFDPVVVEEVTKRILRIHADSEPRWGGMAVASTLAHCACGIEMATGVILVKRASFPGSVLGLMIKPLIFRDDKPMRRNSPSSPELFAADATRCDFIAERSRLIATMESFASRGPAGCTHYAHPYFGPLSPQQWAILMYKHLDHHLRQFGV